MQKINFFSILIVLRFKILLQQIRCKILQRIFVLRFNYSIFIFVVVDY